MDKSGRRRPVPKQGSEFIIEIDTLVPAISQEPDIEIISGNEQRTDQDFQSGTL